MLEIQTTGVHAWVEDTLPLHFTSGPLDSSLFQLEYSTLSCAMPSLSENLRDSIELFKWLGCTQ